MDDYATYVYHDDHEEDEKAQIYEEWISLHALVRQQQHMYNEIITTMETDLHGLVVKNKEMNIALHSIQYQIDDLHTVLNNIYTKTENDMKEGIKKRVYYSVLAGWAIGGILITVCLLTCMYGS